MGFGVKAKTATDLTMCTHVYTRECEVIQEVGEFYNSVKIPNITEAQFGNN